MRGLFSAEARCAAYLVDPLRIPWQELPWAECGGQTLLQLLLSNKVPLLSLPQPSAEMAPLTDALFHTQRQAEAEELASLRAEYEQVQTALRLDDIQGAVIKSVGLTPSFPYRSDNLDVLYAPEAVENVKEVLSRLGYVELRNVEEPHKYLFRKFHAGRSVSAVHVHAHVGWMVSFLDEAALWRRCRVAPDDPGLVIPAPVDALLTTLAHWFYEDKRLSLWDLGKCSHCLRQGVDWDEAYRIATLRGWRGGLNAALLLQASVERALYAESLVPAEILRQAHKELPDWQRRYFIVFGEALWSTDEDASASQLSENSVGEAGERLPWPIPFALSKLFFYEKLLRDRTRGAATKLKDVALHTGYGTKLRLHIHSQRPMLITFSGIDGSGKTTQAMALRDAFETCHLRANYVWTRGGSSRWVGAIARWIGGARRDAARRASASAVAEAKWQERRTRFRSPWLRWGWSSLTALELLWQYTWRVRVPLLGGRVVICDRYVQDALADWSAYFDEPEAAERLAARLLRTLSPRPDAAHWLDVSAAAARARSSDGLPNQLLAAQVSAYRRIAKLHGLERLEGIRGWEELSDEVAYEVLSAYFSRYRTVVNALFLRNPGQWV